MRISSNNAIIQSKKKKKNKTKKRDEPGHQATAKLTRIKAFY